MKFATATLILLSLYSSVLSSFLPWDDAGGVMMVVDCNRPPDPGMCRALFRKFFHNSTSGRCEEFVYGGCGGNGNKFDTRDQCTRMCCGGASRFKGLWMF